MKSHRETRPFKVITSGPSDDAFVTGDLTIALQVAYDTGDLQWHSITKRPNGTFVAFAGFTGEVGKAEDYWGCGGSVEEAMRYLIGAVLDPGEGMRA